ncbi:hypothetical protein niasHS_011915 [Heterodera schachtii]|uniref:Uncharacterized protein n=1 Tax=Heterodera schachtii TaxID=97005 RepID=A0ABD2IWQ7_HETSC
MSEEPSKVEAQIENSNGKKPMKEKSPEYFLSDDEYETANESDSSGPLVEISLSDDERSINVEADERQTKTEEEMSTEKAKGKTAQNDVGAEERKGILGNFPSPAAIFSQFRKSFYGGSSSSDENETNNTEKHASSSSNYR